MPTYIVGDIHITDTAAYQAHVPRALATIARFGGRVVAGGGRVDVLEGDPMPERVFIIEFPTADVARRWYRSNDYQEALKARLSASHGRVLLLEGNEVSTVAPVAGMDDGERLNPFCPDNSTTAMQIPGEALVRELKAFLLAHLRDLD